MALEIATLSRSNSAVDAAASRLVAKLDFIGEAGEWASLIASAPFPQLPQSFAFGAGKAAKGWTVQRVAITIDGHFVAIATVLELRRVGIRLVSRINRGPLLLEPAPSDERVVAVYAALRQHWGRLGRGLLLIAPALQHGEHSAALLRHAGFRLRQDNIGWRSGLIDLANDEAAIWASFSSTFRNRVRKAEKSGAALEIAADAEAFEWMLARHAENMRDKNFTAADATLLRALRAAAPGDVTVFRMLSEGVPVAGMSVVRFGSRAEYHIGWFGPAGRKLNAGNFLMWHVIREMRRRGALTFDVGGLRTGDGYTRFKRTMNPAEYRLAGEWMSF